MTTGDMISYNPGVVGDFATDVGSRAGQLHEAHDEASRLTNALAEYFEGHGATGFFDAQTQMLSGLRGLIETIANHGQTVSQVLGNAGATDQAIGNFF